MGSLVFDQGAIYIVMVLMIKEIHFIKSCVPFLSIPFIAVCKVEQIYIYISDLTDYGLVVNVSGLNLW